MNGTRTVKFDNETDRAAYKAGWLASKRSTTYDLNAAEARYDSKHDDPRNMFSAGWVDYSADRPYGYTPEHER